MIGKIWNRKLFFQGIKLVLFFLFVIIFFYIFVDYFIHSAKYSKIGNIELVLYYLCQIILSFEIFLPLAFLLAIVKILSSLNIHRESVAYQIAGLSKTRLMSPFFIIAVMISLFTLYYEEYLIPYGANFIDQFQEKHFSIPFNKKKRKIQSLKLNDQSQLIYQKYDPKYKILSDVFYVRSFNDIWHIETLEIEGSIIGRHVDHFVRDESQMLKKAASFDKHTFKTMSLDIQKLKAIFVPYENRSLTELASHHFSSKEERASIITQLNKKLILSILSILIIFCIGPYCLQFSRSFSPFLITAISLFSFAGFFALLNGILLLCESQVFSPFTCWTLPVFLFISQIAPSLKKKTPF